MCQFLSAIVLENGDIICDPANTDSHEDLMIIANIRDGHTQLGRFARVEFLPPKDVTQIADLSAWKLVLDEQNAPEWWNEDVVRGKLERFVAQQIVSDKRSLLLGGWWILVGNANVDVVKNVRIISMRDLSVIGAMRGSSQVNAMYGASRVGAMWESSRVDTMFDSSQIGVMRDSSYVNAMYDSSQVGAMWESSQVGEMRSLSRANIMHDNARVMQDNKRK